MSTNCKLYNLPEEYKIKLSEEYKIYAKYDDYFFIAPEEADELIRSSGLPQKSFKYVTFSNMPEGEKRFLMCSKRVDDTLIDTLNAAILEYTKTYRK